MLSITPYEQLSIINEAVAKVPVKTLKSANLASLEKFKDNPDCQGELQIGVKYFDARTVVVIGEYLGFGNEGDNTKPNQHTFKDKTGTYTYLTDEELDFVLPETQFRKFCNQSEAISKERSKILGAIDIDLMEEFGKVLHGSAYLLIFKLRYAVMANFPKRIKKEDVIKPEEKIQKVFRDAFESVKKKLSDIKFLARDLTRFSPNDLEMNYSYTIVRDGKPLWETTIADIDVVGKRLKTLNHDNHTNEDIVVWLDYNDNDVFFLTDEVNMKKAEANKLATTILPILISGLRLKFARALQGV